MIRTSAAQFASYVSERGPSNQCENIDGWELQFPPVAPSVFADGKAAISGFDTLQNGMPEDVKKKTFVMLSKRSLREHPFVL